MVATLPVNNAETRLSMENLLLLEVEWPIAMVIENGCVYKGLILAHLNLKTLKEIIQYLKVFYSSRMNSYL